MNQGDAIRRGVSWMFAGQTGNQILTLAIGIVLARLLAPADFGLLISIQVFTGLAGFVAGGGMGQALVRAKSVTKADYDIVFTLQLLVGLVIFAIFFAAAPWFADWYNQPLYVEIVRFSALSFLFRPFVNLSGNLLYREMRYKDQTIAGVVSLLTSGAVSVGLAYLGYGVWSLLWGGLMASLVQCALQTYLSGWRPGLSAEFSRGREIARYGILVSLNDFVGYIKERVSIVFISHSLGPAAVGLYNKGESLAHMPNAFVTGSVYHILFRSMAAEQDNIDKCRYLFFRSLMLSAVYSTPFYVGLLWLAEPLVRGVYGEKWVAAAIPLQILALVCPFVFVDMLSGAVVAARNRLAEELRIQVATVVVLALAIGIGLQYGLVGVAAAVAAGAVFTSVFMHRLALRSLSASVASTAAALRPALILNSLLAVALAGAAQVMPPVVRHHDLLYVAVMGAIGALVYLSALIYLPITGMDTERERWRGRIKMLRRPLQF